MKNYALTAEPRTELGKKATKALRKEGLIPAVINGGRQVDLPFTGTLAKGEKIVELKGKQKKGIVTTDITVKFADVRKLVYTPDIFVVDLTVDGQTREAVLSDIQFHPVNDSILHMDFLEVNDKKPIVYEVPVTLQGHAAGVKAGGKLFMNMKKVKVKGIYTNIPERIVVNVDNVQIGQTIKVGDLKFDNIELVNPKDLVVAGVRSTRAAAAAATTADAGDETAAADAPAAE